METSILKKLCVLMFFVSVSFVYAQNSKNRMYGVVKDKSGQPIPGVAVMVKTKDLKTLLAGETTDFDGKYSITSKGSERVVIFSFMGMKTQKVPFKNGKFNLVMEEDVQALDEVVISTGYQNVKASEMVGSANKIKMKNLETRIAGGGKSLVTTLEGLTPTLVAASDQSKGKEGNKRLLIRGVSTLSKNSSPLIVVDGFPYEGSIEDLNPYDIQSITMLKDAASASIYGARSGNGVIVVTTKRGKGNGLKFTYNTNMELSGKKDIDYYMNRASSKDLIGALKTYFKETNWLESYEKTLKNDPSYANPEAKNKVIYLLLEHREGRLSDAELQKQLNILENTDNSDDIKKLFLQNPLYQEHNISVDYVKQGIKLRSSLNYNHNDFGVKGDESQGVRYALNSYIDVSDKVSLDLLANFNISEQQNYSLPDSSEEKNIQNLKMNQILKTSQIQIMKINHHYLIFQILFLSFQK